MANIRQKFRQSVERQWYSKPTWLLVFAPLSGLFWVLSLLRKKKQQANAYRAACPVIVVGNIAVGGTGKTPVIIALANALKAAGLTPGIISRGYGAAITRDGAVHQLPRNAQAAVYGDEPVLIAQSTGCPVWIASGRVAALKAAEQAGCTVVLADDGLQHYTMGRSYELIVQDASRGLGNGWCLPVGPLRELKSRLGQADYLLSMQPQNAAQQNSSLNSLPSSAVNSKALAQNPPHATFYLKPVAWVNVKTGEHKPLTSNFLGRASLNATTTNTNTATDVLAVAGIGNPQRFFNTLKALNIHAHTLSFEDHHQFTPQDFNAAKGLPVVMTAKDAIKCQAFAQHNWWYLHVEAQLPQALPTAILAHCKHAKA